MGGSPPQFFLAKSYFFFLERHAKNQNYRQTPSWRKVSGRKEDKERRIMPSLLATMSASPRTTFVRTLYARTNYEPPELSCFYSPSIFFSHTYLIDMDRMNNLDQFSFAVILKPGQRFHVSKQLYVKT